MYNLENQHPNVHAQFTKENFTVQQKERKFNGVWTDLALEKTYNKEGKTTLLKGVTQKAITCVTQKAITCDKYIKAAPIMTKVSEAVRDMVNISSDFASGHHSNSIKQ